MGLKKNFQVPCRLFRTKQQEKEKLVHTSCGWLSIRQLVFYHSVINIYKTLQTTYPKYIFNKLSSEFPYNTRLAQSESVRMGPAFQCKLELTEKSFLNRATVSFNKLPSDLRQIRKIDDFKSQLKIWVLENYKV